MLWVVLPRACPVLGYGAQAEYRQEVLLLGSQKPDHPSRGEVVLQPNLFVA